MSDGRLTDHDGDRNGEELARALSLADGHIEEAENVLWTATREADDDDVGAALEELTRGVWELQHELDDLRRRLE